MIVDDNLLIEKRQYKLINNKLIMFVIIFDVNFISMYEININDSTLHNYLK